MSFLFRKSSALAKERMEADPDMRDESKLPLGHPPVSGGVVSAVSGCPVARLNVVNQAHRGTHETAAIVDSIGGLPALRRFTTRFYQKAFADPHLDTFIRSHDDPHGERFATWIYEKLGAGTPWSEERRTRVQHPISIGHGHQIDSPHDRSSAHFAAWHSPKRDDSVWGKVRFSRVPSF